MTDTDDQGGVDLSGLHRELDRLKARLCRCNHQGECLACRGFEVLRQQAQMVVAAASQPVLMQVAQEAAVKDLLNQLGGAQEKLVGDPRLQDLIGQIVERVSEDLGGPEALERMFGGLGGMPGFGAEGGQRPGPTPPDDRPPDDRTGRSGGDRPPARHDDDEPPGTAPA